MTTKTKLLITARDNTKAAFRSVNRRVSGLERSVRGAQVAFGALLGAGAVGGLVKSVADAGLAMDQINRSLRSVTGSAEGAEREFEFLDQTSKRLGISLQEAARSYTQLAAATANTSLEGAKTRELFLGIAEAGRVLGLRSDEVAGTIRAVQQIASKGVVSMEELRQQLGERLPIAMRVSARAMGLTTAELNDLVSSGKLAAEDFLPFLAQGLREFAASGVDEAVDSAAAAFGRLETALFKLKSAIAESGVLDALASMAEFTADLIDEDEVDKVAEAFDAFGDASRKLRELEAALQIRQRGVDRGIYEDALLATQAVDEQTAAVEAAREKWQGLIKAKSDAIKQERELRKITQNEGGSSLGPSEEDNRQLASFLRKYETAEQRVKRLTKELQKFKEQLDPAEFSRIQGEINSIFTDGLEEVVLDVRKMSDEVKEVFEVKMPEHAKQAARNIQDEFADFLFDPFDKGLKGMLQGFLDVIRRMIAEATAAKIFGAIGGSQPNSGFGGFLKGLIGFKNGGDFTVGGSGGVDSQLVAFKATPGERVSIRRPDQQMGGAVNNYYFEAGADIVTIQREIIPMLQATRNAAVADVFEFRREGTL